MAAVEDARQSAVKTQPAMTSPYVRIDTVAIKQQLHDLLGSRGLPYWEALREYLTGKLGRQELEELVMSLASVVDRQFVPLHNHFLMAIVANAHNSSTTPAPNPGHAKRNRPDDTTPYGAKRRVLTWVLGTTRREFEKLRADEQAEKQMRETERRREERRKTGAGWIGGAELTRERSVLGPSSSVLANGEEEAKPSLPTPISSHPAPLATAIESRALPSAEDLRSRVSRASIDSGLAGASPGVGQFLNAALEDQLKSLITSHIHLHRSSHLNASASTSSLPSLSYTASAPASPTSTSSTLPPQTPPATFSQSALEGLLTIAPASVTPQGHVTRVVGEGLLDEEGFQQLWADAAAERRKITGMDEKWSSAGRSAQRGDEGDEPEEDGKPKNKSRSTVYEYVDPASILDTLS